MSKTKETNKFLYKLLTKNDLQNNITSKEKWSTYFQNDNLPWDIIYNNIYISTIDIKLRNFQYKYLFRIIPTNKRLFKHLNKALLIQIYVISVVCVLRVKNIYFGNVIMFKCFGIT